MIGTKKTGFSKGDKGPFLCSNCQYWRSPIGCVNEKVIADPEIPKIKSAAGVLMARAEARDCCFEFETLAPIGDVSFEEVGL